MEGNVALNHRMSPGAHSGKPLGAGALYHCRTQTGSLEPGRPGFPLAVLFFPLLPPYKLKVTDPTLRDCYWKLQWNRMYKWLVSGVASGGSHSCDFTVPLE